MNYLNAQVIGRLTKDAKVFAANGDKKAMAGFTVAVSTGKDADGKDRTTFVECELRGDLVDRVGQYLIKGKEVMVTGTPAVRTFETANGKGASLALYANFVQLGADPKGSGEGSPAKLEEAPL